jgi:hypothetical protein
MKIAVTSAVLAAAVAACASNSTPPPDDEDCSDGHCDLPTDPATVSCQKRRADAFNFNHYAFETDFMRWSCADVDGVTLDDRGQEYCEYFAVVKPPQVGTDPVQPLVLGKNKGEKSSYGTTPSAVTLSPQQVTALEADETKVVGQCIFTSWNSDIAGPVPVCKDDPAKCPSVLGVPVDDKTFRMTFRVNSAAAGKKLVDDCFADPPAGNPHNKRDPLHDDFVRGCMFDHVLNKTEFRKSDTNVCTAAARMHECGCSLTTTAGTLGDAISPTTKMGFPLGTWAGFVVGDQAASKLPPSCHYIDAGANSQTLVSCDLTAGDLLTGAPDVRSYCQDKYADNIVVHVPVPAAKVTCDPYSSTSYYADSCTAMPWVVTP